MFFFSEVFTIEKKEERWHLREKADYRVVQIAAYFVYRIRIALEPFGQEAFFMQYV